MTKRYDTNAFRFQGVDNTTVYFSAYTTNTRSGFCHTVQMFLIDKDRNFIEYTDTKTPYLNRTWESYPYETTLLRAAEKLPKHQRDVIKNAIRNYN